MPLEWSFTLDSLQAERDQAITIDTTRFWITLGGRDLVIIDAPGHREFLTNMVSGAAGADAAILVIDAAEGLAEQTRRHAYLLRLLGIEQIAVVVNKIDLVGFAEARFRALEREARAFLAELGLTPRVVLPLSARHGDNLSSASANLAWHEGPTLLEALVAFGAAPPLDEPPLRLPLQDIYRLEDQRILVGRIETGRLKQGDTLLFSPSNKLARVKSIEAWPGPPPDHAGAGRSVGLTLDRPIFLERGEVASHVESAPLIANRFGRDPVLARRRAAGDGERLSPAARHGRGAGDGGAHRARHRHRQPGAARRDEVQRDQVAEVVLRSPTLLALDDHSKLPRSGRFVLRDKGVTVGGGLVLLRGIADQRRTATGKDENLTLVSHKVTQDARAARFGHKGGVLWFTGLSGAGKSTLAMAMEQHLFRKGYAVYVLDGDNIGAASTPIWASRPTTASRTSAASARWRRSLPMRDSSASPPSSRPIAPTARARARRRPRAFHEIYVSADLATCEARDPKGLYRKARAGQIGDFTGISAPYEPPAAPSLVVDTARQPLEACLEQILAYVAQHFAPGGGPA